MNTPMEAYSQLILQEMHSGMGVHKVSEKTNHRWKDGFLAGYAAGRREALLERASYYETRGYLGTGHELARELTEKAKELE